jgi:hypothetical protein
MDRRLRRGGNDGLRASRGEARAPRWCLAGLLAASVMTGMAHAQESEARRGGPADESSAIARAAKFLAGGALGLVAHEAGHLAFDLAFDADPRLRRVEFHGVPFFAIAHRPGLPRRQEFVISSAGFWMQHAGSEWVLTRRPTLRRERAPIVKGVLAFNVLASAGYAGAALARTGPPERDTRGMAAGSRTDERLIGAMVLTPAVLDAWRYYHPESRWLAWASRAAKLGMVVLVAR